ncbi:carbonic anhydrase [Paraflavitalea speifideaquila]|uniref:carbonic anhydrase n=1 Tax=Paraflavitalea speifideaquila TaxID=3076558 RepID=UPI0028E19463|nr:carbonic anhydrase [Paraflavitalea speifideiaquila]
MRKYFSIYVLGLCIMGLLYSCGGEDKAPATATIGSAVAEPGQVVIDRAEVLVNTVLTQEQQRALAPADVIKILKDGNNDFVNDHLTIRNNSARIRAAALNQFPKAMILSCLDSRVPVEDVFHRGIGDIFVGRVAGNIVNEDLLGSMEFSCRVTGARVILVMGHEDCGAIKSAIDDVKLGNITALLARIRPAVTSLTGFNGEKVLRMAVLFMRCVNRMSGLQ